MQIQPVTFGDIHKRQPEIHDFRTPRWNSAAGIAHRRHLYNKRALRILPGKSRLYLSLASYTTGYTGMLRVMRRVSPSAAG